MMQMIKKVVSTLLILSSNLAPAQSNNNEGMKHFIPLECLPNKCFCFYPQAVDNFAKKIEACEKDQIDLRIKTQWINEHLEGLPAGMPWWQEPHAIIGGIIVSASVATVVTAWMVYKTTK